MYYVCERNRNVGQLTEYINYKYPVQLLTSNCRTFAIDSDIRISCAYFVYKKRLSEQLRGGGGESPKRNATIQASSKRNILGIFYEYLAYSMKFDQ